MSNQNIPPRIVLDEQIEESAVLEDWLSEKLGKKVTIAVPQKGDNQKLVAMCKSNAVERLAKHEGKKSNSFSALSELANILGLKTAPKLIEAYDISNHAGDENVGAMVTFLNGEPYKAGYKLFKIKTVDGQDDCRSMAEMLDRRFTEYEKGENVGFSTLPDLILLDGGKTQLNAVTEVLKNHNLNIAVFGMVKDSKHKTKAITTSGGEISIKGNKRAFGLVYTIQEEVHRFAIGFHRKRMKNKNLSSELLAVEDVGKATAEKLLRHFKSVNKIKNATLTQLQQVKGVSKTAAQNIYNYFSVK